MTIVTRELRESAQTMAELCSRNMLIFSDGSLAADGSTLARDKFEKGIVIVAHVVARKMLPCPHSFVSPA